LGSAFLSDRVKNLRAAVIIFNAACVIIGTAMFAKLPVSQQVARYVGVFIAVGGSNANVALIISWIQTCIRMQSKRAVSTALVILWAGTGGILAGVTFLQAEARSGYPTGINFCLGTNAFVLVASACLRCWFQYQNRRADRGHVVLEGNDKFRYQL
jgi:peptidoglycan/LPS O-acetylase OafA/YrhL